LAQICRALVYSERTAVMRVTRWLGIGGLGVAGALGLREWRQLSAVWRDDPVQRSVGVDRRTDWRSPADHICRPVRGIIRAPMP
jgi:hypothetical protein